MNSPLDELLCRATREGWSTGHFNVSELDQMRAITKAAEEVKAPVLIGASEGERAHIGLEEIIALRDIFRKKYGIPIFLNADHSKSVDTALKAVDAGFDSVHIDLSEKTFEENIQGTKAVVDYVRSKYLSVSLEGELGYLRGESKIQQEKLEVRKEDYTDPEKAHEFVERTGVDRLAVVVGNIHGISLDEPDLDIERIIHIRKTLPLDKTLVLHAGSGIPDVQIRAAIKAGIANIHINTDIRVAFVGALRKNLDLHPQEVAMYKLDSSAIDAVRNIVKEKFILFGSAHTMIA